MHSDPFHLLVQEAEQERTRRTCASMTAINGGPYSEEELLQEFINLDGKRLASAWMGMILDSWHNGLLKSTGALARILLVVNHRLGFQMNKPGKLTDEEKANFMYSSENVHRRTGPPPPAKAVKDKNSHLLAQVYALKPGEWLEITPAPVRTTGISRTIGAYAKRVDREYRIYRTAQNSIAIVRDK